MPCSFEFVGLQLEKIRGPVIDLLAIRHCHIDLSYVNVGGTFYCLCSILDGCSRSIVHWEIREARKK